MSSRLLAATVLVSFSLAGAQLFVSEVQAEEKKERKYADAVTQKRQSVGKACARRLETVQEVLGADTDPTAQQLQSLLREMPKFLSKDCSSSYERSNVFSMLGYVNYALERYPQAVTEYTKMINEPEVDPKQRVATRYTIAQLQMIQENYPAAVQQLELWMKEATIIGDQARMLLAQAYYQVDRKTDALKIVNGLVSEAEAKGELPKEGWWSLQRVIYYETEDYKKVADILEKLVTHYPSISYWKQLGGMYSQLERDMNALVANDIVHLQKGLTAESQLMTLAYMYLGAEAPYRAAKIIEDGMKAGTIERTGKNLEVLGSAWQFSQDFKKAAEILEQAAKLSDKGEIYARLAAVYLDQDKNVDAVRAAKRALAKGGVKRPELVRMNLGSAQINLHCYSDAIKAFREAAKEEKSKKVAQQWIAYAKVEGERRESLIRNGAKIASCKKV
ncbi:MAG: tetratricopeptide repeat protein [bacterium]